MTYDYTKQGRFFPEPLMKYVWIPMVSSFAMIAPLAIIAGIMNDGGKYLLETYPFIEYILYGWLGSYIPLLITYTILYIIRDWGNHDKWNTRGSQSFTSVERNE